MSSDGRTLPYTPDDVTEVTERLSHGSVTFFVRGKRTLACLSDGRLDGERRPRTFRRGGRGGGRRR